MTVKLRLPPGFFHNGTEYQAAGRWHRGNLMRWFKGMLQPMQGWRRKFDVNTETPIAPLYMNVNEAPRGGMAFTINVASAVEVVIGTNEAVYLVSPNGNITDITPISFTVESRSAESNTGYGSLSYGFSSYGISRPGSLERVEAVFTWGFTNWGFWPIAVARGRAYELFIKDADDLELTPIVGSPVGAFDVLVTDERFVMTFGKITDHLLIEWSDREDYTNWTPTVTNEAGNYRLTGRGKLVRGVTTRNRILVLGEVDAFVGQYLGPPYVYGFDRIAESCGLVAANAVAATERFAVWLGQYNFWIYDGEVKELPCEIYGYFIDDLNDTQISKTVAFTLARQSEIWFLYQSKDSQTDEHDSYIVYNYALQVWYFGRLNRSFGMDAGLMRHPMMVTHDGFLFDHEVVNVERGNELSYIESGPLEANNGDRMLGLQWIYPDLHGDLSAVELELAVRDMPNMAVRATFAYTMMNPVSTTGVMGRAITMKITDTGDIPQWRIGDFRAVPVNQAGPQR